MSVLFIAFALIVRFGAFQVTVSPDHIVHAEYQDIFRVTTVLTLTALGMGKITSYIVQYSKGKESARKIFGILYGETSDIVINNLTLVSVLMKILNS